MRVGNDVVSRRIVNQYKEEKFWVLSHADAGPVRVCAWCACARVLVHLSVTGERGTSRLTSAHLCANSRPTSFRPADWGGKLRPGRNQEGRSGVKMREQITRLEFLSPYGFWEIWGDPRSPPPFLHISFFSFFFWRNAINYNDACDGQRSQGHGRVRHSL
ncbi:hypothetical protein CGRA01v4_11471 [Colletotrichum graminicola]|nr:hypothetical protein CGRA01v4_11471 [Colletotrichum graminicola]